MATEGSVYVGVGLGVGFGESMVLLLLLLEYVPSGPLRRYRGGGYSA